MSEGSRNRVAPYLVIFRGQVSDDFSNSRSWMNSGRPSRNVSHPWLNEPPESPLAMITEASAMSAIVRLRMTKLAGRIASRSENWVTGI